MLNPPPLDDLRHADLMAEVRALLPTLAPSWTDHNASDPGIMLAELLAWLTEMVLFRVDQFPEESTWAFLRLLRGEEGKYPEAGTDLQEAVRTTLLALRMPYRAVTAEDFEQLTWRWCQENKTEPGVMSRVHCLAERDLESSTPETVAPGHVSVILIAPASTDGQRPGAPSRETRQSLKNFLDTRRLLTTRCHVVGPRYVPVTLRAKLYLRPSASAEDVRTAVAAKMEGFFHPLEGGLSGGGWPWGRSVHVSDVLTQVSEVPGVEAVETEGPDRLTLLAPAANTLPDGGVRLGAHELPALTTPNGDASALSLTLMRRSRGEWTPSP